ncbi:MAG: DJ-1/PfpI family protein [Flavobacteriia bacterium]|nr:DJ-1/PfpI family protein [Flavobacteriia bacterium]
MKILYFLIALCLISCKSKTLNKTKSIEFNNYVCPPCGGNCDQLVFHKAGKCPHCQMELVNQHQITNAQKELSVCFYLQDNVEILDFAGPLEVFVVAGFKVFTVSKNNGIIHSQGILKIKPDFCIEDAPPSDVMVFFGGAHGKPSKDKGLISWIKARKNKTNYFISICTGAFIMGEAGILDNLSTTTYHTQIKALQNAFPKTKVLSNVRFVDNGNVISTAGISAGIDGALHFVAKIKGLDFAKNVAATIEYDKWIPNDGLILK